MADCALIRVLRFLIAGLVAGGTLLATPRAARAAASAHLVYVRGPGAEQCAGEQALRAAVSTRLGYDPFFAWAHDTLFAEIQYAKGAFRAVVELIDENSVQRGSREISVDGSDCSVVVDALGLTISLTLDPASLIGAPSPAPEPPPPPEPTASAAPPTLAVREANEPVPPALPQEWSARAGLGAMGLVNAAPSPTAVATAFVGLSWRALSVDVEGRADYPVTGNGEAPLVGRPRTWLWAGALVPCAHVGVAFACVVAAAGALGASAENVRISVEKYGLWLAIGGRLGVEWQPAGVGVSLRAYGELLGILVRDALQVDGTPLYRVGPWSAGVGLAAALRFR